MAFIDEIGSAAKSGVTTGVGGAVSSAIGNLFTNAGHQQRAAKRYQFDLMRGQHDLNEVAADEAARRQKEMWDYTFNKTNVKGTAEQYAEAGFNPLLAVTQSFGGGGGSATGGTGPQGSTSVPGGPNYSTKGEMLSAMSGMARTTKEMQLLDAQRENIEADTNLKEVDAAKTGSETETIDATREGIVRKLNEEAMMGTLERAIREFEVHDGEGHVGAGPAETAGNYVVKIARSSLFARRLEGELGYLTENVELKQAERLLTTERRRAIWKELIIAQGQLEVAQQNADVNEENAATAKMEAESRRMAAEFNYGDEANWKWWVQTGIEGGKAVGNIIKAVKGGGKKKDVKKTYEEKSYKETFDAKGRMTSRQEMGKRGSR